MQIRARRCLTVNRAMNSANKSSAVAKIGDRGHNRHGPKRGGGCCAPFVDGWEPV